MSLFWLTVFVIVILGAGAASIGGLLFYTEPKLKLRLKLPRRRPNYVRILELERELGFARSVQEELAAGLPVILPGKCRLFHDYTQRRDTGKHTYWECTRCHARKVRIESAYGYQPIDRQWLDGGDWYDVSRVTPPKHPSVVHAPVPVGDLRREALPDRPRFDVSDKILICEGPHVGQFGYVTAWQRMAGMTSLVYVYEIIFDGGTRIDLPEMCLTRAPTQEEIAAWAAREAELRRLFPDEVPPPGPENIIVKSGFARERPKLKPLRIQKGPNPFGRDPLLSEVNERPRNGKCPICKDRNDVVPVVHDGRSLYRCNTCRCMW